MEIYFLQIFIIIILGIILKPNYNNKTKKIYMVIIMSIFTVVSALRASTVGADTSMYSEAFNHISQVSFNNLHIFRYEYGFTLLCKILSLINNNSQILIIVTSLFIFISVGRFIYKNSKDVILSCYSFMTLNIYFLYMTAMRQALAIAIILIAYEYLKVEKYFKFSLLIILSSLFHKSALICLILILFRRNRYRLTSLIYTFLLAIISFVGYKYLFVVFTTIFTEYGGYSSGIFSVSNYFGSLIEACVILIIWLFGIYYIYKKDSKFDYKTSLIAYIMSLAFILSVLVMKMNVVNRLTAYFSLFSILWLPQGVRSISIIKKRTIIYIGIYVFLFIYWIVILLARPEWTRVVPYKIFF